MTNRRQHFRLPIPILFACALLGACQVREGEEVNEPENAGEATLNLPAVPLPEPPLGRAELLAAVARAASATASGIDDSEAQRSLAGARFELRIRFGCRGPAPDLSEAIFGWTFDRENRTLRVRATPTISSEDEIVRKFAGEDVEAAEGFWIPRPWLLEPVCPAAIAVQAAPSPAEAEPASTANEADRPPSEAAANEAAAEEQAPVEDAQESQSPPPAWPKVGIVQFFTDADPRTRQRGMRPYETVQTLEEGQPLSSQGFNLVLSGRLTAMPGQRVITCTARDANSPPDCIVSARIDRVHLERPDSKAILAQWGGS